MVPERSRRLWGRAGHLLAVELVPRLADPVASQSRGWTGAVDGSPDHSTRAALPTARLVNLSNVVGPGRRLRMALAVRAALRPGDLLV